MSDDGGSRFVAEERNPVWRLFGRLSGAGAERTIRWMLISASVAANLFGAAIVFALLVWVLQTGDREAETPSALTNLYIAAGYVLFGAIIGTKWVLKKVRPARAWLIEDRPATEAEQLAVLRIPILIFAAHAVLWSGAAVIFGLFNTGVFDISRGSEEFGFRVAGTVVFAGLGTATFAYLLAERLQRPIAARALGAHPPSEPSVPGIKARTMIAWALGAGLPAAGVVAIGVSRLTEHDFDANELAIAMIAFGGLALVLGFFAALLAARAVADPVASLRSALGEVERGNLDVAVPVYDGSEIGLLQSGFNRMVAGVRERERLTDLFGRHVGEDVARAALEGEVEMGGELREVAVLFVDVIGSTKLAGERDPHEVVEILNSFFALVIEVVDSHDGWINKFEGDAALAIFGAPVTIEDPAGCALAAGRELAGRLAKELGEVGAGIGVSFGDAVAGNIGEERRYEYTVIGDPVNEAARLSELAKGFDGRVLASERAVSAAGGGEPERWEVGEEKTLRGRSEPTRLALPSA